VGIVVGVGLALIGGRLLRANVSSVAPGDLVTCLAAAATLSIATALAAWVPTRRAIRAGPAAVLRGE
jgi:predicted lysophospholipase L1 biosynthesis ABC-type transport system permease subunit